MWFPRFYSLMQTLWSQNNWTPFRRWWNDFIWWALISPRLGPGLFNRFFRLNSIPMRAGRFSENTSSGKHHCFWNFGWIGVVGYSPNKSFHSFSKIQEMVFVSNTWIFPSECIVNKLYDRKMSRYQRRGFRTRLRPEFPSREIRCWILEFTCLREIQTSYENWISAEKIYSINIFFFWLNNTSPMKASLTIPYFINRSSSSSAHFRSVQTAAHRKLRSNMISI